MLQEFRSIKCWERGSFWYVPGVRWKILRHVNHLLVSKEVISIMQPEGSGSGQAGISRSRTPDGRTWNP